MPKHHSDEHSSLDDIVANILNQNNLDEWNNRRWLALAMVILTILNIIDSTFNPHTRDWYRKNKFFGGVLILLRPYILASNLKAFMVPPSKDA